MRIQDVYPETFLGAQALKAASGVPYVEFTIDKLSLMDLKSGERVPVLSFKDCEWPWLKNRKLRVCKTTAKEIAKILGTDETDEWAGSKVQLYCAKVKQGAATVEAVRATIGQPDPDSMGCYEPPDELDPSCLA